MVLSSSDDEVKLAGVHRLCRNSRACAGVMAQHFHIDIAQNLDLLIRGKEEEIYIEKM
jgi:hypothetical protein